MQGCLLLAICGAREGTEPGGRAGGAQGVRGGVWEPVRTPLASLFHVNCQAQGLGLEPLPIFSQVD